MIVLTFPDDQIIPSLGYWESLEVCSQDFDLTLVTFDWNLSSEVKFLKGDMDHET